MHFEYSHETLFYLLVHIVGLFSHTYNDSRHKILFVSVHSIYNSFHNLVMINQQSISKIINVFSRDK